MIKNCVKYFSFLVLYLQILSAQNKINFDHLTTDNGLSNSSVTAIFQDQTGFMWFGTQDGLNRYDGYNIKVLRIIPMIPAASQIISSFRSMRIFLEQSILRPNLENSINTIH